MIILLILIDFALDSLWISLGEKWFLALLGLEGLKLFDRHATYCYIQGIKWLWAFSENDKKIPKITFSASRKGSHFGQICSASCQEFEWTLIELPFTLQHDREFVKLLGFISLYL